MRLQAQAQQPLLERHVGGQGGHLAAMDDGAVVHDQHAVAELAGSEEVLFDQQDSRTLALDLFQARSVP